MSKYTKLIARTDDAKKAANLPILEAKALNTLEQSILTVKSQMLHHEQKVKDVEQVVKNSETALENAKGSNPFNPQLILDAFADRRQGEKNLESLTKTGKEYAETLAYLEGLRTELFSPDGE